MEQENSVIAVIDIGSGWTKAGFAGEDILRASIPSVTALCRCSGASHHDHHPIGEAALRARGFTRKWPFAPTDSIDDKSRRFSVDQLLRDIFSTELRFPPDTTPTLITEPPCDSLVTRELIIQTMLEGCKVPLLYVAPPAVLTAMTLTRDRLTGIMVDCGEHSCRATPFKDRRVITGATTKLNVGGFHLAEYLGVLVKDRVANKPDHRDCQDVVKRYTYVARNYDEEMKRASSSPQIEIECEELDIKLNTERIRVPEALFQPSLIQNESRGLHEVIFDAIMKCDEPIREELAMNIILSGGTSMFQGFQDRMQQELTKLAPSTMKISVHASPERRYSTWIGGSILASQSNFVSKMISCEQYQEHGPSIFNQMCS